jgi:hypothetical protein
MGATTKVTVAEVVLVPLVQVIVAMYVPAGTVVSALKVPVKVRVPVPSSGSDAGNQDVNPAGHAPPLCGAIVTVVVTLPVIPVVEFTVTVSGSLWVPWATFMVCGLAETVRDADAIVTPNPVPATAPPASFPRTTTRYVDPLSTFPVVVTVATLGVAEPMVTVGDES